MDKALGLLVAAALMAFAVPSVFDRYVAGMRQGGEEAVAPRGAILDAAAPAATPSPQPAPAARGGRTATIEAGASGHFEVTASLNGRPVHVLVDTGATYVALSEAQARSLGIRLRADDFRHVARTANGESKVALATIDRVRIGTIEVRDVEAMVSRGDALPVALLGMSFLSKLSRFEVRADTLSLVQ